MPRGPALPPAALRSLSILFAADGDARGRGDGNDSDRCCRLPAARGRGWLIAHRKTVYVRAMAQRGGAGGLKQRLMEKQPDAGNHLRAGRVERRSKRAARAPRRHAGQQVGTAWTG